MISVPIPRTPRILQPACPPPRSHPRRRSIRTPDPYQRSIGLEHETLVRFHLQAHCAGGLGAISVARGASGGERTRWPAGRGTGREVRGPIDPLQVPRFAGPATFARLPRIDEVERVDVAIGRSFDGGTTYRPGARFDRRTFGRLAGLLRSYHPGLDVEPFGEQQVADAGDIACNPFSIEEAIAQVERGPRRSPRSPGGS